MATDRQGTGQDWIDQRHRDLIAAMGRRTDTLILQMLNEETNEGPTKRLDRPLRASDLFSGGGADVRDVA